MIEIKNIWRAAVVAVVAVVGAGAADATVTITMTGTTDSSAIAGTGADFTATWTYDQTAAAAYTVRQGYDDLGVYTPAQSMTFSSGTYSLSLSSATEEGSLEVRDAKNSSSTDQLTGALSDGDNMSINSVFSGGYDTFRGTAIPNPDLFAASPYNRLSVSDANGNYYGGTITSYRVSDAAAAPAASVPEPATWAMMVGGFGLLGTAMRRRRRPAVTFG